MARTREKWSGELAGPPEVVARHIEIPVRLYDDPDRPLVVIIPLSRGERFIRAFSRVLARGLGTRALMESPDVLPAGDGLDD